MTSTKFFPTSVRIGACPICENVTGDCRILDGDLVLCQKIHEEIEHPDYKYLKQNEGQSAGVWGIFAPRETEKLSNEEYNRKKLKLQHERQERLESQAQEYLAGLTRQERDANIRRLSRSLGLKTRHREQLRSRGLTDEQIDKGLFFSISPNYPVPLTISEKLAGIKWKGERKVLAASKSGIACVAFDYQGLAIGFQLRDENATANNKYLWAKSVFSSHLQTGEMPITQHGSANWVLLTEGILKSYIAHCRLGVPVLGASNGGFNGSPLQFRASLGTNRIIAIALDGGDAFNHHVLSRWENFINSHPYPYDIYFAWWGQWQKTDPDIDELGTWNPQWFTPEQMGKAIATNATINFWIALGFLDFARRYF